MASGENATSDGNNPASDKWTTWIPDDWSPVIPEHQFTNWPPCFTPLELRPHLISPVGKQIGKRNLRPPCFYQLYEREKDGKVEYCAGPIYLLPKAKKRRADQPGSWKEGTGKPVKCKYCILYAKNGKDPQKRHLQDEELCLLRANGYLNKPSRTRNDNTEPPKKKQKTQPSVSHQVLEANREQVHVEPAPKQPLEQPSNTSFDALLGVVSDEELAGEDDKEVEALHQELQPDMKAALPESHRNESDALSGVSTGSGQSFGERLAAAVTAQDLDASTWWNVKIGLIPED